MPRLRGPPRSEARRRAIVALGYTCMNSERPAPPVVKEDQRQTRRDLRTAVIFGVVAATLELGALIYFFR